MAFDVGLRRTGVAVGQSLLQSAKPAGQINVERGRHDWLKVDQLIAKWAPQRIVIGNPNSHDPALKKCINRLKSHIQQQHKIAIFEIDETLTSSAANTEMADQSLSLEQKIALRDQIAACIILESYFAANSRPEQG